MLTFIGLGLQEKGISLEGLQEAQAADTVFIELYTSLVPGLDVEKLQREIGKPIRIVNRKTVEEHPEEILESSKKGKVVLLVPGDPMVATTHVDLRLRAAKAGIKTKIIHGASIVSAAPGLVGLQSYKFGPSATVPFPDNPSERPYEILAENCKRGLHTLLLLDLRAEEGRALTANEAMRIMLGLEEKFQNGAFTKETLVVVVARAGSQNAVAKADKVKKLIETNFGPPPHVLIVPGKLHFIESEALKIFASAPEEVVK